MNKRTEIVLGWFLIGELLKKIPSFVKGWNLLDWLLAPVIIPLVVTLMFLYGIFLTLAIWPRNRRNIRE